MNIREEISRLILKENVLSNRRIEMIYTEIRNFIDSGSISSEISFLKQLKESNIIGSGKSGINRTHFKLVSELKERLGLKMPVQQIGQQLCKIGMKKKDGYLFADEVFEHLKGEDCNFVSFFYNNN